MGTEKAKTVLDKALQRCQEFPYKDWSSQAVEELIRDTKAALNDEEEQGRCRECQEEAKEEMVMSRKEETVEVKYCDICGAKETRMDSISTCWGCGKEVCPQHHHLVQVEGYGAKEHTYLCDSCREDAGIGLKGIIEQFRRNKP